MFFQNTEQKVEQDISKNEVALQEILIHMDSLDREIKSLLSELKISPEQLTTFINNEKNFTPENWEQLQIQRRLLDEKLKKELNNVRDPRKVQKAQEDRNVQRHWLFVR